MAAPREYELKLAIDRQAAERLRDYPPLAGALSRTERLTARYFDTPDRSLQRAGLSLRVRSGARERLQTLKVSSGSLLERGEWETPIAADRPDLDSLHGTPLPRLGKIGDLSPLVETEVERTAWTLQRDGAVLEVALDQGDVRANGRAVPISEVEVELKEGSPAALFSLARAINAVAPVRLAVRSKAETGFGLLDAAQRQIVKAAPRPLPRGLTMAQGLRFMAQDCLRHYGLNEPLLIEDRNPEALHQCRVALRRLRAVFWLFKPLMAGPRPRHFKDRFRAISRAFGEARNLDVILGGPLQQAIDAAPGDAPLLALESRALSARARSYDTVLDILRGKDFRRLMIDLVEWLEIGVERETVLASLKLKPFLRRRLSRAAARIGKKGRHLARRSDEERHRVRIRAKKLRYVAEFLEPKGGHERQRAFLDAGEALQKHFGELQDLASLSASLQSLVNDASAADGAVPAEALGFSAGYLAGKQARQHGGLLDQARKSHRAFRAAKRIW